MKITSVAFTTSAVRRSQYPTDGRDEFLLVGRSNVGKSSFINAMTNRKKLAYVGNTPGKTRLLNFFNLDNQLMFVDVPGYGYAKINKEKQKKFGLMMEDYLTNRKNLKQVFMLVDFRHRLSNDDIMMYNFLKYYKLPVTIVATKVDKIGITKHQQQRNMLLDELNLVVGDEFVMFSNITKVGKEDVHQKIERTI